MTKKSKLNIILPIAFTVALLASMIYCGEFASSGSMFKSVLQLSAIYMLLAVSLNLLNGFTGLFSHRAAAAAGRWASGRYMVKFTPAGSYCFSACWVPSTMARPQLATGARRFTPPSPTGTSNRFKFR